MRIVLGFAAPLLAVMLLGADEKKGNQKDWTDHKGKIPFIVGFEKAMAEAKFSGRPVMAFFTTTW